MRYVFDVCLADVAADDGMKPSNIMAISKKVKAFIEAKAPKTIDDFPALPLVVYAYTFSVMPREVQKYYHKEHAIAYRNGRQVKGDAYYVLHAMELGMKLTDTIVHKKVVWKD